MKWFGRLPEIIFRKSIKSMVVCGVAALLTCSVFANPVIGNVAAGNVSIQQTSSTTTVDQTSQKAIINWQSFNIGAGQSTHFQQPVGGVALNRISPTQGASQIYGVLTATGQIILINPAGVYFGPSAYVNVGGMIATTENMSNANFMNNIYQFSKVGAYSGAVVNDGQLIAAQNGLIALVAPGVVNNGIIQANLGHVILASGDAFTVGFSDDNVSFAINVKTSSPGIDKNGNALTAGVTNTGSLIANGGTILLSAQTVAGILDETIDMQGVAQAKSVYQKDGTIILSGDPDAGVVNVAATLDASGKSSGETGGTVDITGYDILLNSPTLIDVSGNAGGGNIYIGGNAHGTGPLPDANAVVMMPGVNLLADAITTGNGGNVVLWSNYYTQASGNISAQGGALSGDGGYVETSAPNLDVSGISVNTSAANGATGTWLLDPYDVYITDSATSNGSFSSGTFTPSGDDANILNTDLESELASNNIDVTTTGSGTQNGDIFVNAAITWSSGNTLTLTATNKIFLNADITATNGGLDLSADNIAQSITSGTESAPSATGVTANISVADFNLLQGQWYQVNTTLPTFTISNNFQLDSGIISTISPNNTALFVRALSGNGSSDSPYLLDDIYGVQGMETVSMFALNFELAQNIDATSTANWNGGTGFVPIGVGNNSIHFSGSLNGQGFVINGLTIDRPAYPDNLGLFAQLFTGGVIENIGVTNIDLVGGTPTNSIGVLVGLNNGGTISNAYASGSMTTTPGTASMSGVGGLVGYNESGTISNSYSSVSINGLTSANTNYVGGLVGKNAGNITDSYSTGLITVEYGPLSIGGLVGLNTSSGSIANSYNTGSVNLTNVNVSGSAGGLVGENDGNITNSYNTGSVNLTNVNDASGNAGGLVGQNNDNITNSYNTGSVTGNGYNTVGGLVGLNNDGTISNAYASGSMTTTGADTVGVGGLVGYNEGGTISNSYSNVSINNTTSGLELVSVGGLVGDNNSGSITNSYSTGSVMGGSSNAGIGGLVGYNGGEITSSYSTGSVMAGAGAQAVGGLVGLNSYGTVSNSYSTSAVTAGADSYYIGGLIGDNAGTDLINNTYSTGLVTPGTGSTGYGGLVGYDNGTNTTTNNFWNTQTSGQSTSAIGTGVTTAQMMTQSTFCPSGTCSGDSNYFDFTNTWGIIAGQSYPYLLAFYPSTPRVISGTTTASGGTAIELAVDGAIVDNTTIGADGSFYFLEGDNAISNLNVVPNGSVFLAYLDSGNTTGNLVASAPASMGSLTNLSIVANTITVGASNVASIANADLSTVLGALNDQFILYTASADNLILGNATNNVANLTTTANTTYTVNGTIATTSGGTSTLSFGGPTTINATSIATSGTQTYSGAVTLDSAANLSSSAGAISFGSTVNGAFGLTLSGNTGVTFGGIVGGATPLSSLTVTGATDIDTTGITTTGAQTYNSAATLGNSVALTGTSITLPAVSLGTGTLTIDGTGASSISGVISGSGGLTESGGGTLTLTNTDSSYSGATTISAGTLNVAALAASGSDSSIGTGSGTSAISIGATGVLQYTGSTDTSTNRAITLTASGGTIDASGSGLLTLSGGVTGNAFGLVLTGTGSGIESGAIATTTGTLTKNGTGTWTFTGADTYSGASTLNAGDLTLSGASGAAASTAFTVNQGATLTLDNSSANNTARISTSKALTLNGGQFVFNGSNVASTNAAQTVGALTLPAGFSSIVTLNPGTGGSTILTFASISETAGASVLFRGTNLGSNAGAGNTNILFTSATGLDLTGGGGAAGSTDINIVPYAIGDISATGTGVGFVTYDVDTNGDVNGIRPLNLATEYTTSTTSGTNNLLVNASVAGPASAAAYNSILITGGNTFTISSGETYTDTSGAIFSTSGANTIGVNGTLAFGAVRAVITTLSNDILAITSAITGSAGMTIAGAGVTSLQTNSISAGTLAIDAGELMLGTTTSLGSMTTPTVANGAELNIAFSNGTLGDTAAISLNGSGISSAGALSFSGSTDILSNVITLAGATTIGGTGSAITLNGTINNAQALTINGLGSITLGGLIGHTTALTSFTSNVPTTITAASITTTGAQTYADSITPNAATVTLTSTGAGGNITLNGGASWTTADTLALTASGTGGTLTLNNAITATSGTLNLTASGTTADSVATNSLTAIDLAKFNLITGQWIQVSNSLPTFSATNFELNSGSGPTANTTFIRALSGNGSAAAPYDLTDIYGVQGIDSNATTLGYDYELANNINASGTSGWNSGAGFIPIGTSTNPFTGIANSIIFNGNDFVISNLFIKSAAAAVGLFGELLTNTNAANTYTIENIGLTNANITGSAASASIGALVGVLNGGAYGDLIENSYMTGTVTDTSTGSDTVNTAVGGLVGQWNGDILDSYAIATVNGGTNAASVGGLAGSIRDNQDNKYITDSYSSSTVTGAGAVGGLVGEMRGASSDATPSSITFSNDYSMGSVTGTTGSTNVGGLVGIMTDNSSLGFANNNTISNSYSTASVSGGTNVGGLVGLMSFNSTGNTGTNIIDNSYSSGYVTGTTNVGGLVGSADASASANNSFWDMQASGQSTSAVGTGETTAAMMTQSTFCPSGTCSGDTSYFDFANTWGIIAGQSYPYLLSFYPSTDTAPRVISGTSSATGGTSVSIAINGALFDTTSVGANGFFYFLEGDNALSNINNTIADGTDVLAYNSSGTTLGNALGITPTGGGGLTGLSIATNTITIGNGTTASYSNADLAAAGFSNAFILYTVSDDNLVLGNATNTTGNLLTTANTNYTVNGTITSTASGTSSVTFDAPVTIDANITTIGAQTYNSTLTPGEATTTLTSTGASGNITLNNPLVDPITWATTNTLALVASGTSGTITINGPISAIDGGSLTLSASTGAESITTGVNGNIDLSNFNLVKGEWYQVSAILPTFVITDNFQIDGGAVSPSANVGFIRALSGNGSADTPYMITDVYGLQGIGSNTATISSDYMLANSIDASSTSTWNSGAGFVPIDGTGTTTRFSGTLNGQGYTINDLTIDRPSTADVGLFGQTDGAAISNLGLTNVNIIGANSTAGLVGYDVGATTISNAYATGTVTGTSAVGMLVGQLDNNSNLAISNSYSSGTVSGTSVVGGLVGIQENNNNQNTINNSYSTANVSGTTDVGGLVGAMQNNSAVLTISNSYATGNVTGTTDVGGLVGRMQGNTTGPNTNLITDSYSTSNVTGTTNVGGLVGEILTLTGGTGTNTISGSYSNGTLTTTGAGSAIGGLVGSTDSTSIITNSYSDIANISNTSETGSIGGLVGANGGSISDSYSMTNIAVGSGNLQVGGLVGTNNSTGTITDSYATGSVTGTATSQGLTAFLGGLVGFNSGTISYSYSSGAVGGSQIGDVGGLVGQNDVGALITDSYNTGSASISNGYFLGGITGDNAGTITDSYNAGTITGAGAATSTGSVGGIVGYNDTTGIVSQTYNTGAIYAQPAHYVGGIVGYNNGGSISNSYNTGTITATSIGNVGDEASYDIGGVLGDNSAGSLTNTYNIGYLSGDANTYAMGGLVGIVGTGTTSNSYWNTDTSGQTSSAAGTGLTSAQMMAQANFSGWDFSTVWNIVEGQTYPFLQAFYTSAPRTISGSSVANATIDFETNGTIDATINTNAYGNYYFLAGDNLVSGINSSIADGTAILAYLNSGSIVGNAVTLAPTSNGSITGFNIIANGLSLGSSNTATLSNATLATALGALSGSNYLYSISDGNVILGNSTNKNVAFSTTPTTTYTLNGNITPTSGATSSSVTFNGPVTANSNVSLIATAISFLNSLTGTGNISVTGANSNNTLAVQTGNTEIFGITSANAGTVSGMSGYTGTLGFSNVQNLTGGNNGNTFNFSSNATLGGAVNGTNINSTNTININAYTAAINIILSSTNNGVINNMANSLITAFNNITNINANNAYNNSIQTASGKTSNIYITGGNVGYINDPIYFNGINTFIGTSGSSVSFLTNATYDPATNLYYIDGVGMSFASFASYSGYTISSPTISVSNVVQQPPTNANQNASAPVTSSPTWVLAGTTVDQNITTITTDVSNQIDNNLKTVKINPYCYTAQ